MPKTFRPGPSADEIADMAARGEDVFAFFTNNFVVVHPDKRVSVHTARGRLRPKQKSG